MTLERVRPDGNAFPHDGKEMGVDIGRAGVKNESKLHASKALLSGCKSIAVSNCRAVPRKKE